MICTLSSNISFSVSCDWNPLLFSLRITGHISRTSKILCNFFDLLKYIFLSFFHLCLIVSTSNLPRYLELSFSPCAPMLSCLNSSSCFFFSNRQLCTILNNNSHSKLTEIKIRWQYLTLRGNTLLKRDVLNMSLNFLWSWGSIPEALESVGYSFIAITPESSLTLSGNTF